MDCVVLTGRQFEVFSFIKEQICSKKLPPTVREIAARFGIRNPNGVVCHLDALESKGVLVRKNVLARGLSVVDTPVTVKGEFKKRGVARLGKWLSDRENLRRVLWDCVQPGQPDECWVARGNRNKGGYIMLYVDGIGRNAQRISWMVHKGPIPEGMLVCHHCDNPPCVNPNHLFLGTHQDNKDDMIRKGRGRWQQPWVPDFHV